jgi:hypothetical protein
LRGDTCLEGLETVTQFDVIFSALVILTFIGQIINYTWFNFEKKRDLRMGDAHRYLFITVLAGFSVTESMLAYASGKPIFGLYVLLNLYGIKSIWRKS